MCDLEEEVHQFLVDFVLSLLHRLSLLFLPHFLQKLETKLNGSYADLTAAPIEEFLEMQINLFHNVEEFILSISHYF